MLLIYRIILFSCVAMGFPLHAGNEVGNGGNGVVCKDRVELLDLYEAKVLRKVSTDPAIKGTDPFKIVEQRLEPLKEIDPKSAQTYLMELNLLKTEISFEDQIVLKPIDDSLHSFEPKEAGCKVTQLAVFRKKQLPGEKLVLVDKGIWKRMKPVHQAGLLLHEAIYKHLSDLGEKDSTKARYLVSFILSEEFSKKNAEVYWNLIKKMRLPIYR